MSYVATRVRGPVSHKWIVIGTWLGLAVVLAVLFPQLETVVKQQSLDPIPRDVASFQTLDRMGKALNPQGLTPSTRERYAATVSALRADL